MKLFSLLILLYFLTTSVSAQTFSINERGCVTCSDANPGDTGVIDGVTYTAVDRAMLDEKIKNGEDLTKVCVSLVTDMSLLFQNKLSFNQSIGNWDVSNVINMSEMFSDARSFNQAIGNWDVSNVTDMSRMFFFAYLFNQSIENWNVSSVNNMNGMFLNTKAFNQAIGNWDVSSVSDMHEMFYAADSFNQSIGNWDVSNVTNMSYMFAFAYDFNQPIENWDVSSVSNMSNMFFGNSSFNQSIGNWDVSRVMNMLEMFGFTSSFNQSLNNWCVSSIANEPENFAYESSLEVENKPNWGSCPENPIAFDYVIITPVNTSTDDPQYFQFTWETIQSTTHVQLSVNLNDSIIIDTLLTESTYVNPTLLEKFHSYTVQLRGYNMNENIRGYWVGLYSFNTGIDTPIEYGNEELYPNSFVLQQNYPNPFNPSTSISIGIAEESAVRLEVFNSLGQSVRVLANQQLRAGEYEFQFDASGLSSGLYFYRLQAGNYVETKKMILMK